MSPKILIQFDFFLIAFDELVNAYDDGKSTGKIRHFFGMLGPSDIRKVRELMLPKSDSDYESNLNFPSSEYVNKLEHQTKIIKLLKNLEIHYLKQMVLCREEIELLH